MMPDLEDIDRWERVPLEERRLDRRLGVAGEERGEAAVFEEEDDRPVVDVAIRQRRRRLVGGRVENADRGRRVERDDLTGASDPQPDGVVWRIGQQPVVRRILEWDPGVEDRADREALGDLDEAGHVVLVRVGEDDEIDSPREERQVRADPAERELWIGTSVDEHGRPRRRLDEDRVALANGEDGHVEQAVRPRGDGDREERRRERRDDRDRAQDPPCQDRRPCWLGMACPRCRSGFRSAERPGAQSEHRKPGDREWRR